MVRRCLGAARVCYFELNSGWWLRCLDNACAPLALQRDVRRCMCIARVMLCLASLTADGGFAALI